MSGFASTRLLLTAIELSVSALCPERYSRVERPQAMLTFRLFCSFYLPTPGLGHSPPRGGPVPIACSFAIRLQFTTIQTISTCIVAFAKPQYRACLSP